MGCVPQGSERVLVAAQIGIVIQVPFTLSYILQEAKMHMATHRTPQNNTIEVTIYYSITVVVQLRRYLRKL